jgi:hypothetical protein
VKPLATWLEMLAILAVRRHSLGADDLKLQNSRIREIKGCTLVAQSSRLCRARPWLFREHPV